MRSSPQAGTVVLVHGAWADGYCWSNVILPLKSKGLNVTTAPIPLTTLVEDTAALRRVIEKTTVARWFSRRTRLCGRRNRCSPAIDKVKSAGVHSGVGGPG